MVKFKFSRIFKSRKKKKKVIIKKVIVREIRSKGKSISEVLKERKKKTMAKIASRRK